MDVARLEAELERVQQLVNSQEQHHSRAHPDCNFENTHQLDDIDEPNAISAVDEANAARVVGSLFTDVSGTKF